MEIDIFGNLTTQYQLSCRVFTLANTNRDLLGIDFENTATGSSRIAVIYAIQGTLLGFIEFLQKMRNLIKMNHIYLKINMKEEL